MRTQITARWVAIAGYVAGLIIVLASQSFAWKILLIPGWVMLLSGNILADEFRHAEAQNAGEA